MQILSLILLGLLVGMAAKLLLSGTDAGGFVPTLAVGIAGSFFGAYIASLLDLSRGWLTNLLMAVLGAIVLVALYRFVRNVATTST